MRAVLRGVHQTVGRHVGLDQQVGPLCLLLQLPLPSFALAGPMANDLPEKPADEAHGNEEHGVELEVSFH